MFCCAFLYVHSSFAIILMGKRELIALLSLFSWCLVIVLWFFLTVPWIVLQFVVVVFPDHSHSLYSMANVSLMEVESIAECPPWSIPQYF